MSRVHFSISFCDWLAFRMQPPLELLWEAIIHHSNFYGKQERTRPQAVCIGKVGDFGAERATYLWLPMRSRHRLTEARSAAMYDRNPQGCRKPLMEGQRRSRFCSGRVATGQRPDQREPSSRLLHRANSAAG